MTADVDLFHSAKGFNAASLGCRSWNWIWRFCILSSQIINRNPMAAQI